MNQYFVIMSVLVLLALPRCKARSTSGCVSSMNGAVAGFEKNVGGFISFEYQNFDFETMKFVPTGEQARLSGQFEFLFDEDKGQYEVVISTIANTLNPATLYRSHIELFFKGQYFKIPFVFEKTKKVRESIKEILKQNKDDSKLAEIQITKLISYVNGDYSAFTSSFEGLEEYNAYCDNDSLEDDIKENEKLHCLDVISTRRYRAIVDLSELELARAYRTEVSNYIVSKNEENLIEQIRIGRNFVKGLRSNLLDILEEVNGSQFALVQMAREDDPSAYEAVSKWHQGIDNLKNLESMYFMAQAYKDYALACIKKSEEGEGLESYCKGFDDFMDESLGAFTVKSPISCEDVKISALMQDLQSSGGTVESCEAFGELSIEFDVNEEMAYATYVSFYKQLVEGFYTSLVSSFQAVMESMADSQSASLYTNFTKEIEENAEAAADEQALETEFGGPRSEDVFFGGFRLDQKSSSPFVVSTYYGAYELNPFRNIRFADVPEQVSFVYAIKEAYGQNFNYCMQLGSFINSGAFPIIVVNPKCDNSGGAVIQPITVADGSQSGIGNESGNDVEDEEIIDAIDGSQSGNGPRQNKDADESGDSAADEINDAENPVIDTRKDDRGNAVDSEIISENRRDQESLDESGRYRSADDCY